MSIYKTCPIDTVDVQYYYDSNKFVTLHDVDLSPITIDRVVPLPGEMYKYILNCRLYLADIGLTLNVTKNEDDSDVWLFSNSYFVRKQIVSACNLYRYNNEDVLVCGARHMSPAMLSTIRLLKKHCQDFPTSCDQQGFVDQFDKFYTRSQAMTLIMMNGQQFDKTRNGGNDKLLYSEGVW